MRPHPRNLVAGSPVSRGEKRPTWGPAGNLPGPSQRRAQRTRHAGFSDCGPFRAKNEDAFLIDERLGLFIVCDGVGGRRSGEIAAAEAISVIQEHVRSALLANLDKRLTTPPETDERNEATSRSLDEIREV